LISKKALIKTLEKFKFYDLAQPRICKHRFPLPVFFGEKPDL
jgi:hypothetical protein